MQRIDHVLAAEVTIVDKKDAKDIESFEKDIVYKNILNTGIDIIASRDINKN